MRLITLPKLLLVGAAGAYLLHRARSSAPRSNRRARGTVPPPDANDPVQSFYSENVDALDLGGPGEQTLDAQDTYLQDTGDLYGIHVPPASDTYHLDNDQAMESGQNWLEALQTDAIEGGALPEHVLDIVDENDGTHGSDMNDRPLADRGVGGPAGA